MPSVVAIIGAGRIGAGWAARFCLHGWNVRVFDPDPAAEDLLRQTMERARASLPGLLDEALPPEGCLEVVSLMSQAVDGADWVQESLPERIELKQKVYQSLQEKMDPGAILASSSSVFPVSDLQAFSNRPDQIVTAHPLDPVYLVPLVELSVSARNGAARIARAEEMLEGIGMVPLRLRAERAGHIAGRLAEATWREALGLLRDGAAVTSEIDMALRHGLGPVWAELGLFQSGRLAAGGEALPVPWPNEYGNEEPSVELARALREQMDEQGVLSLEGLTARRDKALVSGLRNRPEGLARIEGEPLPGPPGLGVTRVIPLDWLDPMGHAQVDCLPRLLSPLRDAFLEELGCGAGALAAHDLRIRLATQRIDQPMALPTASPLRLEVALLAVEQGVIQLSYRGKFGTEVIALVEETLGLAALSDGAARNLPDPLREALLRRLTLQDVADGPQDLIA